MNIENWLVCDTSSLFDSDDGQITDYKRNTQSQEKGWMNFTIRITCEMIQTLKNGLHIRYVYLYIEIHVHFFTVYAYIEYIKDNPFVSNEF